MQKMGKEQEHRLLAEMTAIQERVNGGNNPTDALYKVALATDLSDEMVRLLGRMYNNGRTAVQLRSDTVNEKAAAFPLADPEAVIEKLASTKPMLPAEEDRRGSVSQVYSLGVPDWAANEQDTGKAARLAIPLQERYKALDKTAGREYSPYVAPTDPMAELRMMRKVATDAENSYADAMYKLAHGIDELTSFFTQNARTKLADVDAVIAKVYGTVGAAIMDRVADVLPNGCFRLPMEKDASLIDTIGRQQVSRAVWRKTAQPMLVDWNSAPFTLVTNCVALAKQASAKRDDKDQAKQAMIECAASTADRTLPRQPAESLWDEVYQPIEKRAGPLVPMLLAGTAGRYIGGLSEAAKSDEAKQMASYEGALRGNDPFLSEIRTRTMLANMLRSDDVLQGYDEGDITNAFNTLTDMAPTAMGQSGIAQSSLRKYLAQGSIDPFDAEQLLKIDRQLGTPSDRMAPQQLISG